MANQPECKCIVILFVQPKLSFNWDCDYKRQDKYCSFRFIYFFIICLRFEKKNIFRCFIVLERFISVYNNSVCTLAFRYHHTGPVSGFFALRESLAILAERVKGHFIVFGVTLPKDVRNFSLCCLYNSLHYNMFVKILFVPAPSSHILFCSREFGTGTNWKLCTHHLILGT